MKLFPAVAGLLNCVLKYVANLGTTELDITNNWWGDATGPYDFVENPAGNIAITYSGNADPFPFRLTAVPAPE